MLISPKLVQFFELCKLLFLNTYETVALRSSIQIFFQAGHYRTAVREVNDTILGESFYGSICCYLGNYIWSIELSGWFNHNASYSTAIFCNDMLTSETSYQKYKRLEKSHQIRIDDTEAIRHIWLYCCTLNWWYDCSNLKKYKKKNWWGGSSVKA